jgi:hypothetical protein
MYIRTQVPTIYYKNNTDILSVNNRYLVQSCQIFDNVVHT